LPVPLVPVPLVPVPLVPVPLVPVPLLLVHRSPYCAGLAATMADGLIGCLVRWIRRGASASLIARRRSA
jgi:hypothetical protein